MLLSPSFKRFALINGMVYIQLLNMIFFVLWQHYKGSLMQSVKPYSATKQPVASGQLKQKTKEDQSYGYYTDDGNYGLYSDESTDLLYTEASLARGISVDESAGGKIHAFDHRKDRIAPMDEAMKKGKFQGTRENTTITVVLLKREEKAVKPPKKASIALQRKLGSGGFCEVYLAQLGSKQVAIRIAKKKQANSFNYFNSGYYYNYQFARHNISPKVSYYFQVEGEQTPGYVMRLMQGDLHVFSKRSFEQRVAAARQVISLVERMHNLEYFHGDIKPGNILVSSNDHVYISDVDSVAFFGEGRNPMHVAGGTRGYRDPELVFFRKKRKAKNLKVEFPPSILKAADVFSTTATVFFLLFKHSFSTHVLTAFDCGTEWSKDASEPFTDHVLNNYDYFVNSFIEKLLLAPQYNPNGLKDPIARLFENGLKSMKTLEALRSNLQYVTEADVSRWQGIFDRIRTHKIELNCNVKQFEQYEL